MENADLFQVYIDLVIVQNLNAEVYVLTVRQDDMFIFSLNKEMFPSQWTWTGATSSHSTDNDAAMQFSIYNPWYFITLF